MTATSRVPAMQKTAVIALKLGVTAGAVVWLLTKVELANVIATVRMVPPGAIVLAALLIVAQALLAAVRWHLIMRYLGIPIRLARTLQIFWIGQFATALLPGGVAGDGVRMWVLSGSGARPSKCINSVLFDRAAALTGLILLVAAVLPFVDDRVAVGPVRYGISALLIAAIASGLAIGLLLRVPACWQHFRVARGAVILSSDLRIVIRSAPRVIDLLALSAGAIACNTLTMFLLVRSLGVAVPFGDCMVLAPLVILATTLPVAIGGWGLREGSTVGLFALIGVTPAVSLAASITIGLLSTLISVPGALIWLQQGHTSHAEPEDGAARADPSPRGTKYYAGEADVL